MSISRPVTVVTGGSRGIGAAICARLAADGHDLAIGYRADADAAAKVAETVRAAGGAAVTIAVDTADAASVDHFFTAAAAALGPVTGLVNNAGTSGPVGRLADADPEQMRRAIDVNFLGYLLCARRAIQEMLRDVGADRAAEQPSRGAIVNISSAAATLGGPGEYVHYAASKAAVDGLTVGLSKELAADGIRVNCVAPGVIWTEFHLDPERPAKRAAMIPMGRSGRPEEIAGAVSWLLSPDASYATGTIMRLAGGM